MQKPFQTQAQTQARLPFVAEPEPVPELDPALHAELLRHSPAPEPGRWDEMRHADARLRDAWQAFMLRLPPPAPGQTRPDDLDHRVAQLARQIRQDGITHNVFDAPGAAARPWALELLPLIIDRADWRLIEAGVMQRAALLEALLADAYGAQQLLHEGLFPPALLLRHPGYLRSMQGVAPASGMRLHLVAFDLARAPDGSWQCLGCSSQNPSGLGYVLHNRMLVSRQFADAFRALQVQHIAGSYRRLLDALEGPARAVAGGAAPRIALLTPGPYSETHFEHAYLARYLGLPLVEGGDLMVREQQLHLKTVEGLAPVHGLLRRLDDDWCDPLELRADSALGVPGLLQAVRAGRVVMANALGSGFVESPAIHGFLPAIARRLLGQELLLPSPPTWWCGEAAAWRDVRPRLAGMVVRSAFPRDGSASVVVRADAASIDDDADAWVVTERVRLSRAPVWQRGTILARPAVVRVYAIAEAGGRWHVLPGGMTRVAQADETGVSMQRGGASLDTWVRAEGAVDRFSMLPSRLGVDDIALRRPPVSSRAAENLFWLGRYTERTEQLVRLARALLLLLNTDERAPEPLRDALNELAVRSGLLPSGVPALRRAPQRFERALLDALPDAQGSSVAFNLAALERAAQGVRERLSTEQWNVVHSMGLQFQALRSAHGVPAAAQALSALDRLGVQLSAVTGAQGDRMTRDHGWRFMTVGRLLERLIGLSTQLLGFVEGGALRQSAGMETLLELFDSAITFHARYQRHGELLALTDLLVLDSANPRALAGVLRRLRTELRKLPGDEAFIAAQLARLPREGAGIGLEDLRDADDARLLQQLQRLCGSLRCSGSAVADELGLRFFAHAAAGDELQHV